jgi:protein O-mannosyl-transferase
MGRKNLPRKADVKTASMPSWRTLLPVWGALVACVWIAFSPALSNGFVDLDDPDWILENHSVRGLGWEQIQFAFTTLKGGVYQPLGWLLQSFVYTCYGLNPRGYHLVSLLFHVVNVILLHRLCVGLLARTIPELTGRLGAALGWLCGMPVLLYAVHPLRVEMVAWASPQAYLPSITFSLLATLAYLEAHPASGVYRRSWMIRSSVLIALAVLTKGSAIVLPFVFLIVDAYPLNRLGPGRPTWRAVRPVLVEKAPILVFCLIFTIVAFVAKQLWIDPEDSTQPVLIGRVAQACFGACFYLAKTVWPFGITAYYPRPENEDFRTPLFAMCFAAVVLAVVAAFRLRRRWPWLAAALAAYFVIAAPYLGLARVSAALASDRYCHAPILAWVVLGCAGLCKLAARTRTRSVLLGAGAATLLFAAGLTALCSIQCRVWSSSEGLWNQALGHAEWSSQLHYYMGAALAEAGKSDKARAELHEALRLRPYYFDAIYDLGVLADRCGQADTAAAYLRAADKLRPNNKMVQLSLGGALMHQGHVDEAIALYREAIKRYPDFPNLRFNLGVALLQQKRVYDAIGELQKAVALRPWYTEARVILGGALALDQRLDDAIAQYREALRQEPANSAARVDLGLTLARQGHPALAIAELREAILRDGENAEAHHVLGAILVSVRRIKEATIEFEEVLRLRPDHAEARAFLAMARQEPRQPGRSTRQR